MRVLLTTSDDQYLHDSNMSTTPTYGTSCFPFAVNCRFSKTFLGVPKRCGYCQKMIVGTGFTCQHCSFKCHKRCIMIGQGTQMYLRPKPCSLSRLPPGDDIIVNKLLKECEINCNGLNHDSGYAKDDHPPNGECNGNATTGRRDTGGRGSSRLRRHSRPFTNHSSFTAAHSGSLPNENPCCSQSLYSASTATSPSLISQPSSPGVISAHRRSRRRSRRDTVVSNAANNACSRRASAILINSVNVASSSTEEKRPSAQSAGPGGGLMDRLFRLLPSWNQQHKNGDCASRHGLDTNTAADGGGSRSSLHSDTSRRTSLFKSKPLLHTKSTPSCHHALVRCTAARSHHGSPLNSIRGDSNNRSAFDKLYVAKEERRKSAHEILYNSAFYPPLRQQYPSTTPNTSPPIVVEQASKPTFQNGTCVKETPRTLTVSEYKPTSISPLLQKFRIRNGMQQHPTVANGLVTGHRSLRNHESDPIKVLERRSMVLRDLNDAKKRLTKAKDGGGDEDEDVDPRDERDRLSSTWPLCGYHIDYDDFDRSPSNDQDGTVDQRETLDDEDTRYGRVRISDLGEWTIPYGDLVFNERVHECRNMITYRGRWHGDVMIHTYVVRENGDDHLLRGFLEEVRTLTKIRHENVALFMGASLDAPLLAVVTSIRKGCNLYETLHLENRRLAQTAKVNVARQVAQGMGYLHAKGIVLKTLTSKSIYLEFKVKISMIDDGAPLKRHDRPNLGCIRRGHLTYLSPELMQNVRVSPPALLIDGAPFTKESDVFAFGTILYEMFANTFPFVNLCPDAVVWAIGTGRRQSLENVQCNPTMKGLIEECWSADPLYRPCFTEILKEMQQASSSHRNHSTSVPEKLNKSGTHRSPYNF